MVDYNHIMSAMDIFHEKLTFQFKLSSPASISELLSKASFMSTTLIIPNNEGGLIVRVGD